MLIACLCMVVCVCYSLAIVAAGWTLEDTKKDIDDPVVRITISTEELSYCLSVCILLCSVFWIERGGDLKSN